MAAPHFNGQQQGFGPPPPVVGGQQGVSMFNPGNPQPAPAPVQGGVHSPAGAAGYGQPGHLHHRPGPAAAPAPVAGGAMFGGAGGTDMAGVAGQMAAQAGLAQAQSLAAQYIPGVKSLWLTLQVYFQVNNTFVINRLKTLLFPFRKTQWGRHAKDGFDEDAGQPVLPVADPNAPDLYIPCMAFVTYVLLTGLTHGTQTEFTPETLVNATSAALVTQVLELGVVRLALFLAATPPPSVFDLVAWGGYKYVGTVLATLAYLLGGYLGFYAALAYCGAAAGFFTVQTLQAALPQAPGSGANRNYAVLGLGALQPLIMWWLASQ